MYFKFSNNQGLIASFVTKDTDSLSWHVHLNNMTTNFDFTQKQNWHAQMVMFTFWVYLVYGWARDEKPRIRLIKPLKSITTDCVNVSEYTIESGHWYRFTITLNALVDAVFVQSPKSRWNWNVVELEVCFNTDCSLPLQ